MTYPLFKADECNVFSWTKKYLECCGQYKTFSILIYYNRKSKIFKMPILSLIDKCKLSIREIKKIQRNLEIDFFISLLYYREYSLK